MLFSFNEKIRLTHRSRIRSVLRDAGVDEKGRPLNVDVDSSNLAEEGDENQIDDEDEENDRTVGKLFIQGRNYADCCLEVRREARDVAAVLPRTIDPRQQTFVISAPQWFVDRSGLNIVPESRENRPYVTATNQPKIYLLEDAVNEGQQAISLKFIHTRSSGENDIYT